jgi:hypothetical protein
MKMNPSKCNYTIFSGIGRGCLEFDLHINWGRIPYNPELLFLGVKFDERLCFATHFANLRSRALKRLNIIKIFSHGSWHLNFTTLTNLYRALIGSIFDYSFFTGVCVSDTNLNRIQTVQNRAIRTIYRLDWRSPTANLFPISGVLGIKVRFLQLGVRYFAKAIWSKNPYISLLLREYLRSWSAITAHDQQMTTPLCFFTGIMSLAYACIVAIFMSVFSYKFMFHQFYKRRNIRVRKTIYNYFFC